MKHNYEYLKNSNTGEIIKKYFATETRIDFPVTYYDINGREIEDFDPTGFVNVSEKTYIRERRKRVMKWKELRL